MDYAKLDHYAREHYKRYRNRVNNTDDSLSCQDCGGEGGYTERILDDGSGPFVECGWCLGTGRVTKWVRGFWLRCKRSNSR